MPTMPNAPTEPPLISDRSGVTDAVRVQILATEHWSLLATRSMTWNEIFSRAGMFLTVLSAAVVALALMAQATEFGDEFRLFAFLVLPVVLFLGWATYARLTTASYEELMLVIGMNRLRHGYLDVAPDLAPYFVTACHDDEDGIFQSLSFLPSTGGIAFAWVLSSTPILVGTISAVVAGVLAGLAAESLGAPTAVYVVAGVAAGLAYVAATFAHHMRVIMRFRDTYRPRFPG